ncbi:30S ribosomal protein S21 [Candidatus Saccharibacteria bacterium]|nr:30S ribosomal protein S21 [Candidatus Saccharibacteria bacterium]MCB9834994.1 30S ribosomal protein S21 [Candidatus Nomurabacteria bacterium]
MIKVTRKNPKEPVEFILRRFNRRVLQSGLMANVKSRRFYEKQISKSARRKAAIIRENGRRRKSESILGLNSRVPIK